ncbi:histidine kinase [Actinopolymorpha pittospori]|uniref:Signal transduction histidine kinase n=1 Tax=Actinopolymorpha pittospori TaxID=648752 RepID=A0A927RCK3_9ACTN|nr:histidine kinase [Actinopolymorpha pittospori]MBE1609994.1 signal transduction histidine kinase [Actinopolymorpha pittospori]
MVCAFAHQAALALQHLRTEEQRAQLLVLEERDRIASDLRDSVIGSLSAAELDLQSAAGLSRQAEVRHRVDTAIEAVDSSIQAMRDTIFQTRPPSPRAGFLRLHTPAIPLGDRRSPSRRATHARPSR